MARLSHSRQPITRGKLTIGGTFLTLTFGPQGARAQDQVPPVAAFKAGVDLVRIRPEPSRRHQGAHVSCPATQGIQLPAGSPRPLATESSLVRTIMAATSSQREGLGAREKALHSCRHVPVRAPHTPGPVRVLFGGPFRQVYTRTSFEN